MVESGSEPNETSIRPKVSVILLIFKMEEFVGRFEVLSSNISSMRAMYYFGLDSSYLAYLKLSPVMRSNISMYRSLTCSTFSLGSAGIGGSGEPALRALYSIS
jgi:hypothetical protein